VLVGLLTVGLGQALQVLLGPYSRLQGTFIVPAGIAVLAPDSRYYLGASRSLASIFDSPWTNWSYLAIGRLGHASGDAATLIAVLQLLVATGVATALYITMNGIAGIGAGWVAAAAFAVNPLTAQWFRFVHTETLFFSTVIAIVLIAGRGSARPSRASDAALVGLGVFAALLRPNGVLVLLSALAIVTIRRADRRRARLALLALVLLAPVLLGLGHRATGDPAEGSLVSQLYDGVVVEGTPDVQFVIAMPPAVDAADESLTGALFYVAAHPTAVLRLFFTRIGTEVAQVRTHYPLVVNIAAAFAMCIFLVSALVGILDDRTAGLRRPAIVILIPILVLVGLTFATPEARYGWGGLVALTPFVGVGVARLSPRLWRPTPVGSERP
jgi:hypothetical protein